MKTFQIISLLSLLTIFSFVLYTQAHAQNYYYSIDDESSDDESSDDEEYYDDDDDDDDDDSDDESSDDESYDDEEYDEEKEDEDDTYDRDYEAYYGDGRNEVHVGGGQFINTTQQFTYYPVAVDGTQWCTYGNGSFYYAPLTPTNGECPYSGGCDGGCPFANTCNEVTPEIPEVPPGGCSQYYSSQSQDDEDTESYIPSECTDSYGYPTQPRQDSFCPYSGGCGYTAPEQTATGETPKPGYERYYPIFSEGGLYSVYSSSYDSDHESYYEKLYGTQTNEDSDDDDGADEQTQTRERTETRMTNLTMKAKGSDLSTSPGSELAGQNAKLFAPSQMNVDLPTKNAKKNDKDFNAEPLQCNTGSDGTCQIQIPASDFQPSTYHFTVTLETHDTASRNVAVSDRDAFTRDFIQTLAREQNTDLIIPNDFQHFRFGPITSDVSNARVQNFLNSQQIQIQGQGFNDQYFVTVLFPETNSTQVDNFIQNSDYVQWFENNYCRDKQPAMVSDNMQSSAISVQNRHNGLPSQTISLDELH